jgi:hypothetical protein
MSRNSFDPYSLQPIVTVTLLVSAVIFPPLMLLNFPLLMLFTYLRFSRQRRLERHNSHPRESDQN